MPKLKAAVTSMAQLATGSRNPKAELNDKVNEYDFDTEPSGTESQEADLMQDFFKKLHNEKKIILKRRPKLQPKKVTKAVPKKDNGNHEPVLHAIMKPKRNEKAKSAPAFETVSTVPNNKRVERKNSLAITSKNEGLHLDTNVSVAKSGNNNNEENNKNVMGKPKEIYKPSYQSTPKSSIIRAINLTSNSKANDISEVTFFNNASPLVTVRNSMKPQVLLQRWMSSPKDNVSIPANVTNDSHVLAEIEPLKLCSLFEPLLVSTPATQIKHLKVPPEIETKIAPPQLRPRLKPLQKIIASTSTNIPDHLDFEPEIEMENASPQLRPRLKSAQKVIASTSTNIPDDSDFEPEIEIENEPPQSENEDSPEITPINHCSIFLGQKNESFDNLKSILATTRRAYGGSPLKKTTNTTGKPAISCSSLFVHEQDTSFDSLNTFSPTNRRNFGRSPLQNITNEDKPSRSAENRLSEYTSSSSRQILSPKLVATLSFGNQSDSISDSVQKQPQITLPEGILIDSPPTIPQQPASETVVNCFGFCDDDEEEQTSIINGTVACAVHPDKNALAEERKNLKRFLTNPEPIKTYQKRFKKNKSATKLEPAAATPPKIFASTSKAHADIRVVLGNQHKAKETNVPIAKPAKEIARPKRVQETENDERQRIPSPVLFEEAETVQDRRKSYNRPTKQYRKRRISVESDHDEENEDHDGDEHKQKNKRKKKLVDLKAGESSKESEELEKFASEFNSMCEEVDQYELITE